MTTTEALPSSGIVARADEELEAVKASQVIARDTLGQAQEDLGQAQERLRSLQSERDHLQVASHQAQADYDQASTYASLAQGTPGEATAIARLAELKKSRSQAERALSTFEKGHAEEESTLRLKEPELRDSISAEQEHLNDLAHKEQSLQTARTQAWQALGKETFDEVLAAVQAAQAEVDRRAAALVEVKLTLHAVQADALDRLVAWNDLYARAVQEHGFYQDATVRVLSAFIQFVDTLAVDGPALRAQIARYSVAAQIELSSDFVDAIIRREPHIDKKLESRRTGTQQLIDMYLAERR